jgi:hypothetical protein
MQTVSSLFLLLAFLELKFQRYIHNNNTAKYTRYQLALITRYLFDVSKLFVTKNNNYSKAKIIYIVSIAMNILDIVINFYKLFRDYFWSFIYFTNYIRSSAARLES